MKRSIVNMLAVFVLLLACTLGFAACGKKAEEATLKNEDVVGVWYSTQVVVEGSAEGNGTYTYERYLELDETYHDATINLLSATEEEREYYTLKQVLSYYNLTEEGEVFQKTFNAADYSTNPNATWEIVNNAVTLTATTNTISSITWARNNELAIVTVSFTNGSTCTYTLERVVED